MASKDILMISSSPSRQVTTYNMSSSPLPSPSEVFAKKAPILQPGGRAASIPQNATASFSSTLSLFKSDLQAADTFEPFGLGAEDDKLLDISVQKPAKSKSRKSIANKAEGTEYGMVEEKPRKTTTKKNDAAIEGAELKKPQKRRAKKAEEGLGEDGEAKKKAARKPRARKVVGEIDDATKEKTIRKSRAKKAGGDAQMKLPNAQITKVSVSKGDVDATSKLRKSVPSTKDDLFTDSLDYGLAEAVKRRSNWTPPPAAKTTSSTMPITMDLLDSELSSAEKSKGFQDLFGNFGFSKADGNTTQKVVPDGVGTRKRKLVEMLKTNVSASATILAQKPKAPKKKPKTITEQATSIYAEEHKESMEPAPLLQYFYMGTTSSVTTDRSKIPPRPRSKSPVKGGRGTARAPILLSPQSALKEVDSQDFVFGTSSQLAQEEDPTFLRDVHAAMQASNEVEDDSLFASLPARFSGESKSLPSMKRSLWSAAARDRTGQLLDVEIVDLVDSPAVTKHFHTAAVLPKDIPPEICEEDNELWNDTEDVLEAPTDRAIVPDDLKPVETTEVLITPRLLNSLSTSIKDTGFSAQPSTQPKVEPPKAKSGRGKAPKRENDKAVENSKPDFSAYTLSQLVKEIASYHFKPVKSRNKMIQLLEKCWEGKQEMARKALEPLETNLPISSPVLPSRQAQTAFPTRSRGKPKKDSTSSPPGRSRLKTASVAAALSRAKKAQKNVEALDEISDSDTAPALSPPRRHPSQVGTPPLPLQLTSPTSVKSPELSPTSSQVRLFKYITTAIRSAPPSKHSSNPSWHEKILLYDPIILEDLTVWLNTSGLQKAGWDGEVDPKDVKKWCESKSICCLWKENLRGGTRSRY